eukprot:gb/GECG01005149.1/.p1 GENE.gb/GECG01005149.1/~~gb/GECG01005149.1/.p1  ORF type:complete len:234 (+),score=43.81 gb/GECG01005149.1/:1-702(+)
MSSNHLKLQVDIVSDIVCPWCYVGYRRFFKGWEQLRKENQDLLDRTQLNLRWQPFQLDPTMPKEGVKTKDALRKKFGPERMHALQQHLQEAGREENIDFKWDNTSANTIDAHRLVEWVAQKDETKHNDYMQILFKRYFEENGNIGDHAMLLDAIEEVGLDKKEAEQYLKSNQGKDEVENTIRSYQERYGIRGVPFFIIKAEGGTKTSKEYTTSGAQDPGHFATLVETALEQVE